MEAQHSTRSSLGLAPAGARARAVSLLGPLTVAGGVLWALAQPYRITLLHPHHQGFWWLAVEPPILVVLAGLFFGRAIARPLLADLAASRAVADPAASHAGADPAANGAAPREAAPDEEAAPLYDHVLEERHAATR